MLETALLIATLTILVYSVMLILWIVQYKKKVKENQALEQVNEQLLIEKYDLKKQLGEG